ncbi:GNAT family N-acetyltransferase [Nocardioides dilutus]
MDIRQFGPDDAEDVAAYVELRNAVQAVDAPWVHPMTVRQAVGAFRHGWDGEPDIPFLGVEDGTAVAFGSLATSDYDNLHLAWVGSKVHPGHRRRGLGSQMLEAVVAEGRSRGRTSFGVDAWDSEPASAFAARHGFEPKSAAINRRQMLAEVDIEKLRECYNEALAIARDYELVRRAGATPDDELAAVAEMTAAINDAPTDDLDIEDEVFPPERIRAYEDAMEARGHRLYRVLARHRATGVLAGHTVVAVDSERPELAEQHDTSVVGSHRGHRLGLLLKAEMNLWLHEAEPQIASIDTWNAESNAHMIGVNELLGYRVMGREVEYQRSLAGH